METFEIERVRFGQLPSASVADWTPIRPGAYYETGRWEALHQEQRHMALILTSLPGLRRQGGWVLSHRSAAVLWNLPVIGTRREAVEVSARADGRGFSGLIDRHRVEQIPDAVLRHGIPVTSVARTVIDVARVSGLAASLAVAGYAASPSSPARDGVLGSRAPTSSGRSMESSVRPTER